MLIVPIDSAGLQPELREMIARESPTAHQHSFTRTLTSFELLRTETADSAALQTIDLILRELRTLRSVAVGSSVMINRSNGNMVVLGVKTAEFLEGGLQGCGLLLSPAGWEPGPTLGAILLTTATLRAARGSRVVAGRWAGAFRDPIHHIVLPGLQCFTITDETRRPPATDHSVNDEIAISNSYCYFVVSAHLDFMAGVMSPDSPQLAVEISLSFVNLGDRSAVLEFLADETEAINASGDKFPVSIMRWRTTDGLTTTARPTRLPVRILPKEVANVSLTFFLDKKDKAVGFTARIRGPVEGMDRIPNDVVARSLPSVSIAFEGLVARRDGLQ